MSVVVVQGSANQSILLNGGGTSDDNRIKIETVSGATQTAANIGASGAWTVEFWINATSANQQGAITAGSNYNAINGNSIVDNDKFHNSSTYEGSWVITLGAGVVNFGVGTTSSSQTIQGGGDIRGVGWRHVMATFNTANGNMQLYVNGTRVATATGPTTTTNLTTSPTYPSVCGPSPSNSSCSFSIPFIVCGAEKHDLDGGASGAYPGAYGGFTDFRLSNIERETGSSYTVPSSRLSSDANTVCLWPCTGSGTTLTATTGPNGVINDLSRSSASPY